MNDSELTTLIKIAQEHLGLTVDGNYGPMTRAAVVNFKKPKLLTQLIDHWLIENVIRIPIHPSWYSGLMSTRPKAIVWHYTDTDSNTAITMAKNRIAAHNPSIDRPASWHVTIETDGRVIQMAPFDAQCWHAGGQGSLPIAGLGRANEVAIGIELVGHGDVFPRAQVESAQMLTRILVQHYSIDKKYAMIEHSKLSPGRRKDPGPVWMSEHASDVLNYAYSGVA